MSDDLVLIALTRISEQLGEIRDLLAKMPAPGVSVSDPIAEYQVSRLRRIDAERESADRHRPRSPKLGCR